ncbi:MAG: hypothetical protein ABIP90_04250 [Vicinamibacterales bacterium]
MTGAHTLERMADRARTTQGAWAGDLTAGDWVIVRTKNSVYTLAALSGGRFQVSGGWFTSHGGYARIVRVLGCTWGGRAILTDMIAAPGMFIEFDNGVQTTRVQDVRVLRSSETTH